MITEENEFLLRFHAMFAAAVAFLLKDCLQETLFWTNDEKNDCGNVGNTVFLLVIFWHLTIFFRALLQFPRLLSQYKFLLPLSLWMVLPDWFLVRFAGTLEFPRNGVFWMIGGAVHPAMAGMWSIPGLLILKTCYPSTEKRIGASKYAKAGIVGLVVFTMSEQLLPFIWKASERVVTRVGWDEGVALYVLPAETLLGPLILYFHHATKESKNWYQPVIGAGLAALVYTGCLSIGLLAFEVPPHDF